MAVKVLKPTTPGRRNAVVSSFSEITEKKPLKALLGSARKRKGRNNQGKITVRHRGGGVSRKYRMIDFKREKYDIPARVETIEYDPNRSSRIALVVYNDGERRYIIAPDLLKVGQIVLSSQEKIEIESGNRMPLKHIPTSLAIYNIELVAKKGGVLVRGAGTSAHLMAVEGKYALIKLPSKEIRKVSKECFATIGAVGNSDHRLERMGKAGIKRRKGIRPTVRGKAMNPVDHPHGGGEGSCPIGMKHPKTPWGKPALGYKTRKAKKKSTKLIIKRRPTSK